MSRQRLKVLAIIKDSIAATGQWPTARQITDAMGWKNTGSVADCISSLARNGHLRRIKNDGPVMQRYEIVEDRR